MDNRENYLPATVQKAVIRGRPLRVMMRAKVATDRLIDMAHAHHSVFVVGHGIMTTLIARRLLHAG
jgi:hypothetical protein